MIFRQITYGPDGCASYLIGCPRAKEAVVVDALAAVGLEEYLLEAADRGLNITHVVDTHVHADHLSLGRELAAAVDARWHMGRQAQGMVSFPFHPLGDGETFALGQVGLTVLETPGHTPDSISLVVSDRGRSQEPWLVLTGDSLFVGDVGRPDLLVGDRRLDQGDVRERAGRLHESLERLLALPDHVEIYPAHFGGSSCGGVHMSGKAASTIGFERRFNLALQHRDREAFTEFVLSTLKPQPNRFQEIKRQNLGLEVA